MPSLLLSWDFCRLKRIYYGWTLSTLLSCLTSHDAYAQNVYTPAPHGRWITGTQTAFNPTTGQIIGTWQLGFTPCDTSGNPLPYNYDDGMSSAMNNGILAEAGLENQVSYINNDNSLNMTGQIFFQSLNSHYTVPTVRLQDNQPTSIGSYPTQTPWNQMLDGGILYDGYDSGNMGRMPNGDILLLSNGVMANNYYLPFGAPAAAINGNLSDILSVNFQGSYRWDPNFTPAPGYTGPEPIKPIPPTTLSLRIMPMGWYDFSHQRTDIDYSMTRCKLQIDDSLGNLYWYGNPFWTGDPNWEHQPPSTFVYFPNADLVQAQVDPESGIASVTIEGWVFGDVTNTAPLSQYGQVINYVTGQYQASILPDTRAVTIHRDDQLVRGETQDPDGTLHGDTLFSYLDYTQLWNPSILNWQTFAPNFTGNWSTTTITVSFEDGGTQQIPNVTWSWSPDESEDTELFGKWSMPFGSWDKMGDNAWMSLPPSSILSNPSIISYTATDNVDGAQATAKYVMTFHQPAENWARNGAAVFGPDRVLSDPSNSGPPTNVATSLSYQPLSDSYNINDLAKAGGMVIATITPALVALTDASTDGIGGLPVSSLLGGIGYAAGTYVPGTTLSVPVSTTEAQFVQDAKDQVRINNKTAKQVPSLNDVAVLSVNRFADAKFPSIIANASPSIQSEYWSGTVDVAAEASGYPAGTFTVSSTAYQETTIQSWLADWYDVHGPILQADGVTRQKLAATTTIGGTPIAVNTWKFTLSAPPAQPAH